jgi:phosphoribosylanthranilate isomerase
MNPFEELKNQNTGPDDGKPVQKVFVQIYEIQNPLEAEAMIMLGVDRIGSVVLCLEEWKNEEIRDAIRMTKTTAVKSSLLPLFSVPDVVYRAVDYYEPDVLHFCESFINHANLSYDAVRRLISLQEGVRKRFPEVGIMRSIPVGCEGTSDRIPSLEAARIFEPVSDFFLLDTFLAGENEAFAVDQPEAGFVGITGKTCDWNMAAKLVQTSKISVILAGGISPENVSDGIAQVKPAGVDSCTHTNAVDPKGNPVRFKKDPGKVKRLVEAVKTGGGSSASCWTSLS